MLSADFVMIHADDIFMHMQRAALHPANTYHQLFFVRRVCTLITHDGEKLAACYGSRNVP